MSSPQNTSQMKRLIFFVICDEELLSCDLAKFQHLSSTLASRTPEGTFPERATRYNGPPGTAETNWIVVYGTFAFRNQMMYWNRSCFRVIIYKLCVTHIRSSPPKFNSYFLPYDQKLQYICHNCRQLFSMNYLRFFVNIEFSRLDRRSLRLPS